jgi:hypothetical protein
VVRVGGGVVSSAQIREGGRSRAVDVVPEGGEEIRRGRSRVGESELRGCGVVAACADVATWCLGLS